ncbi:cathelicidin-B1-like [Cuculus canorus]|uniref:cathelicidin-B1-like n=1 Tax=Cuculus canorus TaxID=55661 RepID=UPI0023AB3486|nr:cathelicidin-B1-like [Cuculus canorus]
MRPCPAVLLLLLLVGLSRATTPTPDGSTPALVGSTREENGSISPAGPPLWAVSYEDIISAVLKLLNTRAVSPYVLRLREVHPQPGWLRDLRRPQELSFSVEETSCPAPGVATNTCKTFWFGVRLLFPPGEEQPMGKLRHGLSQESSSHCLHLLLQRR